jgi:hypothetical protein
MPANIWKLDEKVEMGSCRFAANDKLFELARRDSDVILITCDNTSAGSPQEKFWKEFRDRFIDVCGVGTFGEESVLSVFRVLLKSPLDRVYLSGCRV